MSILGTASAYGCRSPRASISGGAEPTNRPLGPSLELEEDRGSGVLLVTSQVLFLSYGAPWGQPTISRSSSNSRQSRSATSGHPPRSPAIVLAPGPRGPGSLTTLPGDAPGTLPDRIDASIFKRGSEPPAENIILSAPHQPGVRRADLERVPRGKPLGNTL